MTSTKINLTQEREKTRTEFLLLRAKNKKEYYETELFIEKKKNFPSENNIKFLESKLRFHSNELIRYQLLFSRVIDSYNTSYHKK